MFDRSKGWDMAKAKTWVEEHVKAAEILEGVDFSEPGDITEEMALAMEKEPEVVWKQLLRPGKWTKQEYGQTQTINITQSVIDAVKAAFDAGVVPHVYVPSEHSESPRDNTGFVKALRVVKDPQDPSEDGLWCGIVFTEPDIAEMVRRGTIANISAWLTPNYVDSRNGSTWPWVLRHAALTNQPVLHLKPFAASEGVNGEDVYVREVEAVETKEMNDQIAELSRKLEAEQTKAEDLATKLSEASGSIETLQAEKKQSDDIVQRMEAQLAQATATLHDTEVKTIVATYQGRGVHDKVKMPAGMAFAPAVLSVVEPLLKADDREKSVRLSVDTEDKASVTDMVLSVLNAVAEANGGLVSLEAKGSQDHTLSQGEETEDQKEKAVSEYLEKRHLAPVDEA